jgi:hypothetical protein
MQDLQFTVDSNAAGMMAIAISERDLTVEDLTVTFLSVGATTDGSVSVAAFLDAGNALFGTGTALFSTGPSGGPSFNTDLVSLLPGLTGPFSVTLQVTIDHAAACITTGGVALNMLPEPMTTALLGLGLLGAGVMRRRAQR